MTEVVNFLDVKEHWNWRTQKWDSPEYEYIGRANAFHRLPQSFWANPFRLGKDTKAARGSTLGLFRRWLNGSSEGKKRLERLHTLDGKTLVCWCRGKAHGQPCHGEVLLEFMGERTVEAVPDELANQISLDGTQQPVLAWDAGGAAYESGTDRRGDLYRTDKQIAHPIGVPGKVYERWTDWYRDFLKLTLRVKGCSLTMSHVEYAQYRYETSLHARENMTDERAVMEREILKELLAELETEDELSER